jgi:hypothetical protein
MLFRDVTLRAAGIIPSWLEDVDICALCILHSALHRRRPAARLRSVGAHRRLL